MLARQCPNAAQQGRPRQPNGLAQVGDGLIGSRPCYIPETLTGYGSAVLDRDPFASFDRGDFLEACPARIPKWEEQRIGQVGPVEGKIPRLQKQTVLHVGKHDRQLVHGCHVTRNLGGWITQGKPALGLLVITDGHVSSPVPLHDGATLGPAGSVGGSRIEDGAFGNAVDAEVLGEQLAKNDERAGSAAFEEPWFVALKVDRGALPPQDTGNSGNSLLYPLDGAIRLLNSRLRPAVPEYGDVSVHRPCIVIAPGRGPSGAD